jgi:hypothetical protein
MTEIDIKRLSTAAIETKRALGLPNEAGSDHVAEAINKLAQAHNVLISYNMRPLPSHGVGTARATTCSCVCVCACGCGV